MAKQMNVEQAFKIKKLLAERRLSITTLALKRGEAYGSVANTIYGHRCNRELQAKIAGFLGVPVAELFGVQVVQEQKRSAGETPAPPAPPDASQDTEDELKVSHG
jgi:hypothetical protein